MFNQIIWCWLLNSCKNCQNSVDYSRLKRIFFVMDFRFCCTRVNKVLCTRNSHFTMISITFSLFFFWYFLLFICLFSIIIYLFSTMIPGLRCELWLATCKWIPQLFTSICFSWKCFLFSLFLFNNCAAAIEKFQDVENDVNFHIRININVFLNIYMVAPSNFIFLLNGRMLPQMD